MGERERIYWWNASKLAQELRDGRVNEKERLKYYLATLIALNMAVQLFVFQGSAFTIEAVISAAVALSAAVIGTILCHKANRSGDNTDFIARMICLGLPIGIQIAVGVSVACVVVGVIQSLPAAAIGYEAFLSNIPEEVWRNSTSFPGVLFVVPYYWAIYRCLTIIAHAKGATAADRNRPEESSQPV